MKNEFDLEESKLTGPKYWRSLDEVAETPAFNEWVEREFPQGASELEGVNRRQFMKVMGASFAFAGLGLAGCRRPESNILPYSKQPERIIPGVPVYYASSMPGTWGAIPIVVETHEARPTKIEGNESYLPYGSATNTQVQASILDMYDPDRATKHYQGKKVKSSATVKDLLQDLYNKYNELKGAGLSILAEPSSSPTRKRLKEELLKVLPEARWYEYHAINKEGLFSAWSQLANEPARPLYQLQNAKRILAVDSDFTATEPDSIRLSKDFAKTRKVKDSKHASAMSRLYSVESNFSLTGGMADHRLRLSSSEMTAFLAACLLEVMSQKHIENSLTAELKTKTKGVEKHHAWIQECVSDLLHSKGEAVVIAGSHLPEEAHVFAIELNRLIGAFDNTVKLIPDYNGEAKNLDELIASIEVKQVETLLVLGGNPAYDAPGNANFAKTLRKVPELIRLAYYFDETSQVAIDAKGWHISSTHYLESWGDSRAWDGTVLPVQPMIEPLFDSFQENELLARLAGLQTTDPYTLAYETYLGLNGAQNAEDGFRKILYDGFQANTGELSLPLPVDSTLQIQAAIGAILPLEKLSKDNLEIRLIPDSTVYDGRYNNNGWLQECPDPMSKLTWDNSIQIGPKLAKEIGWDPVTNRVLDSVSAKKTGTFKRGSEHAPVVELTVNGKTVKGPLQIQPGLADYTVLVSLGYGRQIVGRVGEGTGFSAYPLLDPKSSFSTGATIKLTDETYKLAVTQEHWSMEGRAIIREANVDYYEHHSEFAQHMGMESHAPANYGDVKDASLAHKATKQPQGNMIYQSPVFTDPAPNVKVWNTEEGKKNFKAPQQWGMNIDLNLCNGCNACVVGCQSENNIPIVGKSQVMHGREMHWIRLDRYYSTGNGKKNNTELPEDPQASVMPMACSQCETAPCEQVCPVNATVHDEQGLNVMAYNRCVGTRYCANNCPYKVRRFNFFDYNKRDMKSLYAGPLGPDKHKDELMFELPKMQKNPDVTVRMRGVMEKCNYCQQRIEQARIAQRVKAKDSGDIDIPDGVIKTACQQVCPAEAITFGAIDDPTTVVSQEKNSDRDYSVLGYLNTRPRTTYLARLRNPNKMMPDYASQPLSAVEYKQKTGGGLSDTPVESHDAHANSHGHTDTPKSHH